jgi:DNA polymerase sigma
MVFRSSDLYKLLGGRLSTLTNSVISRFNSCRQTLRTITHKIRLWKEIYRAVRREFDCGLFVFGSTFNGFGLEESDMDMCLLVQVCNRDAPDTVFAGYRISGRLLGLMTIFLVKYQISL